MSRKKENDSEFVRVGSVSILLYPWRHPSGRQYWRFVWHDPETGRRKYATRADYKDAKKAARDKAVELANGSVDFTKLTDQQRRAITRLLAADATLANVDEFLAWQARKYPKKDLAEAVTELLTEVERNKGDSIQNLRTLRKNLTPLAKHFAERDLASITTKEISDYVASNPNWGNRTRRNIRGSVVTLFRWAQAHEWLPDGKTAAERVPAPISKRKTPETWSPEEMITLLQNVRPEYLSWLAACAFGGFRTDEIYPLTGGTKSPLDWSDFHWDRNIIIVREETSKTLRRVVPILPALRAWLWPIKQASGPVGAAMQPPTKQGRGKGAIAETKRLGELVGGWRKNAIRHSWISYRAALVGIGQASMEAGNSESEAKKSYNDAKGPDEAKRWFALMPQKNCGASAEHFRKHPANR